MLELFRQECVAKYMDNAQQLARVVISASAPCASIAWESTRYGA
jgi:hypothetical protein